MTLQGEIKRIFTGWMFAASPGLHAVEHPIYDVWLADCKGAAGADGRSAGAEPAPRRRAQRASTAASSRSNSSRQPQQQPSQPQQRRAPQQRRPPPPTRNS